MSVWRHPRRLGFILFNLVALKLVISWLTFRSDATDAADAGKIMDTVLVSTGITILIVVWVGMWVAWGLFLFLRHRRRAD